MPQYSATLLDHFYQPRNAGALPNAHVVGRASLDGRAPYLDLYLRFDADVITAASFATFGCAAAIACGSVMTELVFGRSVLECDCIDAMAVTHALDGIPPEKAFCADLAVRALRNGLAQHTMTKATP